MIINHNLSTMNAMNKMQKNSKTGFGHMEKLASGLRINTAADDAAGLSISEKMRGQIRGLQQASRNVQDGSSLVQTAEGGLQEITSIIQRQKELITQGLNGTYADEDRQAIDQEIRQLNQQIDGLSAHTDFNEINLLGNEYVILADRSSTDTVVNISDPPKTRTGYIDPSYQVPGTTADVPRYQVSRSDVTATTHAHSNTSSITPITAPDGREGENEYTVDVHTATQTTTTTEVYETLTRTADPKYTAVGHWYTVGGNDTTFAPKFGPQGYPNLYGSMQENIEVDGTARAVEYTTRTGSGNPAVEQMRFPNTDLIVRRERTLLPDNSVEVKYIVANGGASDADVKLDNMLKPPGNSNVSDGNGNPMPIGTTVVNPVSGRAFEVNGSLADAGISFDDSSGLTAPSGLVIDNPTSGQPQLRFDWSMTIPQGTSVTLGFTYGPFALNMDVFERTHEVETTRHIEETIVTDITDIDYVLPKVDLQVGSEQGEQMMVPLLDVRAKRLGIADIGLLPPSDPNQSLAQADKALARVSNYRGRYGALQNRLEYTMNNANNVVENLVAAESRIRDADMAKEMMNLSKMNILSQASQTLLAQANQDPQIVLQLLK